MNSQKIVSESRRTSLLLRYISHRWRKFTFGILFHIKSFHEINTHKHSYPLQQRSFPEIYCLLAVRSVVIYIHFMYLYKLMIFYFVYFVKFPMISYNTWNKRCYSVSFRQQTLLMYKVMSIEYFNNSRGYMITKWPGHELVVWLFLFINNCGLHHLNEHRFKMQ